MTDIIILPCIFISKEASLELNIGLFIVRNCFELWAAALTLMAGAASIDGLRSRGFVVVNRIGSSSMWSSSIILTLYQDKGELHKCDGVQRAGLELLSIILLTCNSSIIPFVCSSGRFVLTESLSQLDEP